MKETRRTFYKMDVDPYILWVLQIQERSERINKKLLINNI